MIPENRIFPYMGKVPIIDPTVFLASGVKIIGDVTIGKYSSVWYNTIIRGDVNYITIGGLTNIQDGCILHVNHDRFPLTIGSKVTIGHGAKLHGCMVKDQSLIGIGAILLDGSVVEENSIVAAGAVLTPGFVVPGGKLVAGVPAKVIRNLTSDEIIDIGESAIRYKEYSQLTVESLSQNIR